MDVTLPSSPGAGESHRQSAGSTGKPPVVQTVSCTWCGTTADGMPLDWAAQTSDRGRGVEYLCPICARSNLRSIEAQLDSDWW